MVIEGSTFSGSVGAQDKIVQVAFDPQGERWTFANYVAIEGFTGRNPGDVRMDGPGDVILLRTPATAPWKFVGAAVKNPGDQFKVKVPKTGESLSIRDDWKEKGEFPYLVIVQANDGRFFTSPDPVIVNSGPL